MHILVLGSAAGGGYPQWNCRCSVCRLAWEGDRRVRRRTQSCVAVSARGEDWFLLNCSPDIREQIAANFRLWPRGLRHSPIAGVVITNADVDHVGGLLSLRERWPLTIFSTRAVREVLGDNPMMDVLAEDIVRWRSIEIGTRVPLADGLEVEAFQVPGKVPLFLEQGAPESGMLSDATVGLTIRWRGQKPLVYIPGCAGVDDRLLERIAGAGILLFDGTLYRDDELLQEGVGQKTGGRMGHMPIAGEGGSLAALEGADAGRRIYIHINNTNPVLIDGSPERRAVEAAGWEVAEDGMELSL